MPTAGRGKAQSCAKGTRGWCQQDWPGGAIQFSQRSVHKGYLGLCRQHFQQPNCREEITTPVVLPLRALQNLPAVLAEGQTEAGQGHRAQRTHWGRKSTGRDGEGRQAQEEEEAVPDMSSVVLKRLWWHGESP